MSMRMNSKRLNWKKARRAFTLIELLVVLVILALLAGIVLPRFLEANKKAQQDAARTQISSFKQAIQLYMLDHNNQAPKALDELISDSSKRYLNDVATIPKDPWSNEYVYESEGPSGDPWIMSMGADGKEGGTGFDADITSADSSGK